MATQVQFRRGTTADISTFIGADGEVVVDTTKKVCVIHDGVQVAGYPLLREDGSNSALSVGSLSNCALKFVNDPNTGIISPGADQVALVTGGSSRLSIDSAGSVTIPGNLLVSGSITGSITFDNGSAGLPAVRFTNDPDTGIYLAGTNQLAISTGGSGRLFVDASGNVRITSGSAWATADGNLQLSFSTNEAYATTYYDNHSITFGAGTSYKNKIRVSATGADNAITFHVGATSPNERMRITGAGLVGIGTAQLYGILTARAGTNCNFHIRTPSDVGSSGEGVAIDSLSDNAGGLRPLFMRATEHVFLGSSSERLRITSAGFVGVGTSTPASTLNIRNDSLGSGGLAQSAIALTYSSTNYGQHFIDANGTYNIYANNNGVAGGSLQLRADTGLIFNTASNERLRITSAGLVGIGTNSPSFLIHGLKSSAGTVARFEANGTDSNISVKTSGREGIIGADTSQSYLLNTDAFPWTFWTNNIQRMTITSAGLVGIGTSSPSGRLTIANDSALNEIEFTGNDYTNVYSSTTQGFDIGISNGSSTGPLRLLTANTERLRITSAGNVGIGTTSPGQALSVAGNISSSAVGTNYVASSSQGVTTSYLITDTSGGNIQVDGAWPIRFTTNSNERARIDSSGRLLVGTSSARTNYFNTTIGAPLAQFESTDAPRLSVVSSSPLDGFPGQLILAHQQSGTTGGNTTVTSSSSLGMVSFQGSDGTEFVEAARIEVTTDGTPGANDMPGRLVFSTTADGASSPTERMRIDSSGRVGIGTSPGYPLDVVSNVSAWGLNIRGRSADNIGYIRLSSNDGATTYAAIGTPAANTLGFDVNGSERARIDSSGRLLVGTSTTDDTVTGARITGTEIRATNTGQVCYFNRQGSDGTIVNFNRSNVSVGTISVTTSATAYNTSSDYRLKENVAPVTDGIIRLQQLKPSRFNFIADPKTVVDGFIAHEVQTIVPEAITGEKDAVDADGNPVYQGIDQSKLVPLLTAALQEAVAKIESLETRLTASGI